MTLFIHPAYTAVSNYFLAGTSNGLFDVSTEKPKLLWGDGEVKKITQVQDVFFLLTSQGIIFTTDFKSYEARNAGLPVKTLKLYVNGQKSFKQEIADIKDFEILPDDPSVMVCATKDAVYLSRDAAKTWRPLGLSARTAGVKAVTVAMLAESPGTESELVVFMSHPIYGISYIKPNQSGAKWTEIQNGLELFETTTNPDEVSDILTVKENGIISVFAVQTFRSTLYALNWQNKTWTTISNKRPFACARDGLNKVPGGIICTALNSLEFIPLNTTVRNRAASAPIRTTSSAITPTSTTARATSGATTWAGNAVTAPQGATNWVRHFKMAPGVLRCAAFSASYSQYKTPISLCELWLLDSGSIAANYAEQAHKKKGMYLPAHQINYAEKYAEHRQTIKNNNLNMVVVDMKDDFGILRFKTDNQLIKQQGRSYRTIDLDTFIPQMKADKIYLVARIVTFKDPILAAQNNGIYAVKDKTTGGSWKGYHMVREKAAVPEGEPKPNSPVYTTVKKEYDEVWVDPYCEKVWEYNVEVARELIKKGFDEIQFDYIRFPTDGVNLDDAVYSWRDPGMDKESAIMSFLSYARNNIDAPISIDIYGANGFYRTGARTGQDVEMIARYVDVICPMFYPNHFENNFLAYEPAIDRPYRIYFYGTFRNSVIARNQAIIRPYAQAFYMRVAYDVKYYNTEYVQRQIFGVRDSVNRGYTYWNNSGRYDDLRPDPADNAPYPWAAVPAESVVPSKPLMHTPSLY